MSRWSDADKAYQLHSATCGECQGAGTSLDRSRKRCEVGAGLWRAYRAAGRPDHFRWAPVPVQHTPMQDNRQKQPGRRP